jgi:hypothetical protein
MLEQHLPTITPQVMPPPPVVPRAPHATSGEPTDESFDSSFHSTDPLSFRIFPLYAALSSEEQLLAFEPSVPGIRKIVLATNIAETSVTISGIKYVIDPGKVKTRCMHPFTGADMLQVSSDPETLILIPCRSCQFPKHRLNKEQGVLVVNVPVNAIASIRRRYSPLCRYHPSLKFNESALAKSCFNF